MKRRKLGPKALRRMDQAMRARRLAEMSNPLVADLYLAHAQICEAQNAPTRRDLQYERIVDSDERSAPKAANCDQSEKSPPERHAGGQGGEYRPRGETVVH